MIKTTTSYLDEVSNYYADKLIKYGNTPQGVDWNSEDSQIVRFKQICKIIDLTTNKFSLNDLGCGYGAFLDYLNNNYAEFRYLGVDVSNEMIKAATKRFVLSDKLRFINSTEPDQNADYSVASGIFNVRLGRNEKEWFDYLQSTLDTLNNMSIRGFAFNCLTTYSDEKKKRDYLYYADPCRLFDLCKRRYSKQVSLLHDYGLYEFTILVRRM